MTLAAHQRLSTERLRATQIGVMTYVGVAAMTFVFSAWLTDLLGMPIVLAFLPNIVALLLFLSWDRRWSGLFLGADGSCGYRNLVRRRAIATTDKGRPTAQWRRRRGLWCLQLNDTNSEPHLVTSVAVVRKDLKTRSEIEATLERFGILFDDGDEGNQFGT